MFFLLLGILGIALKYLAVDPVAGWPWWVVLAPFGLAVLWWWWADKSGYTEKKAMEKMEKRKQSRIERQRDAMGMLKRRK
ncbi:TIGR04438 family Trp-rich protein [Polaromonas sp.]|uniref:TIGR04438 family Trp-rich protein n=1 Tax=Polaromonas sp. TaxID=1869339 RepID=UPI003CC09275